jgi:quinol monooxygenase YgiN
MGFLGTTDSIDLISLAWLVTIQPYFKAHPGKEEQVAAVLEKFVTKTRGEAKCLFYEFSGSGEMVFCGEGYEGAAGVNHHLENIGEVLAEMLTVSDLMRLEFHGPAEELDKLRGPLAHLNAEW